MTRVNLEFEQNRQFEGPPELIYEYRSAQDIYDPRGMPGHISVAQKLTRQYGPEGTGWGVWKLRYANENQLKDELHAPEFRLALEAFRNWWLLGAYELNDGTDVSDKIVRYTREPDMVDVVVYPDGKAYRANDQSY